MRLNRLDLSGFKSFAKPTSLEFPVSISAIVGPNGSGKSNVAEAIRWVLGEQSMKALRGKRGEDLIFNGSPGSPRLGKAGVLLHFDNQDGAIPVEFPEAVIERRIFRDGTNEYLMNGSVVRLKDIVELMARIGLGENKHNIIGQGEVDRWLLSSARDRKDILEEALGLKVYQMKKDEAEKKLHATEENMRQVEALVREIAPHLRFLKNQAEKARTRGTLEEELHHLEYVYFRRQQYEIEASEAQVRTAAAPIETEFAAAEKRIADLQQQIETRESSRLGPEELAALEKEILGMEERRRELERQYGRTEGRLGAERDRLARPLIRIADASYVKEKVSALLTSLRGAGDAEARLKRAVAELESLIRDIEKGSIESAHDEGSRMAFQALEAEAKRLESELKGVVETIADTRSSLRERDQSSRSASEELRKLERELRQAEEARSLIRSKLERAIFEREAIATRRVELAKELQLAAVAESDLANVSQEDVEAHQNAQELLKKIERLRGKLEEVGGIDTTVIKEYEDTEARHAFLSQELEDLRQAVRSLKELAGTLERQIADDFDRGFKKINEGFNEYFQIIFGGGKARLVYQELGRRRGDNEEEPEEEEETEYGIDIDVDIPRKRIKSLSMLSGGERALTSIALLFAMVSVNPPPFLVLDEADAALDEANSQKYANTLVELSKKTQLIIITHNRETMMRAGILYGVTMGDDGVSKLLSIKLEEGEKYTNR